MSTDLYRDPSHAEMIAILACRFRGAGFNLQTEFALPNGRRADIIFQRPTGVVIIEVKADLRWRHFAEAQEKYGDFANCLYIASPLPERYLPNPSQLLSVEAARTDHIGVWQVGWNSVRKIRPARWQIAAATLIACSPDIERANRGVFLSDREAGVVRPRSGRCPTAKRASKTKTPRRQ